LGNLIAGVQRGEAVKMSEIPKKDTILIVNDTSKDITILGDLLNPAYKIKVALTGEIALEMAGSKYPPDIILLDILIPGMNGYEVCRQLKANPKTHNIPVIFVKDKSEVADDPKGFEIGAADYITKPFSPSIVLARIKTHLTQRKASKKVMDAFGRHVHPSVAKRILNGSLTPRGTMEIVTLLFSDIRDFTGFAEQNHPQQVFTRINEYFASMTQVIQNFGGVVLQYVGDEIEAVFGAPFPNEQHPEKAFLSALEMRRALKKLNSRYLESGQSQLNHGIGIHTGPVLSGIVGSKDRQTYCLVGDTVNVASRMANLCKVFNADILISKQTYDRLTHNYKLIEQPPVLIKGRSEKLTVYRENNNEG
jgi:adenylate cyclase